MFLSKSFQAPNYRIFRIAGIALALAWYGQQCAPTTAFAQAYFLRGDAFFCFKYSDIGFHEEPQREPRVFKFEYLFGGDQPQLFLSPIGCKFLTFDCSDRELLQNAVAAGHRLANNMATQGSSMDEASIACFVVSNRFRLERWHVGLRYNENWPEVVKQYNGGRRFLTEFVDLAYGVEESWRDSTSVPSLPIVLENVASKKAFKTCMAAPGATKILLIPLAKLEKNHNSASDSTSKLPSITDIYELIMFGKRSFGDNYRAAIATHERFTIVVPQSGETRWKKLNFGHGNREQTKKRGMPEGNDSF